MKSLVEHLKDINEWHGYNHSDLSSSKITKIEKIFKKEDLIFNYFEQETIDFLNAISCAYIFTDESKFSDRTGKYFPSVCICLEKDGFYIGDKNKTGHIITLTNERGREIDIDFNSRKYKDWPNMFYRNDDGPLFDITSNGQLYEYTQRNAHTIALIFSFLY